MKKLHEVARSRRLAELKELTRVPETVQTEQQPTTNRSQPVIEQPESFLDNTLQRLLDQSASNISPRDSEQALSLISSIRKEEPIRDDFSELKVKPVVHPPSSRTLILPKKNYKESSREEIAKLKQRRKQLESQPIGCELSRPEKVELERIWDEVERQNTQMKSVAKQMLYENAGRTLLKALRRSALRKGFELIQRQSNIILLIRSNDQKTLRRVFDQWYFTTEDRKEESRRLLIMKQRIRADDELRKLLHKTFDN